MSHTAAILAEVLAAGPHAERQKYDPHASEPSGVEEIDLEDVGRDAKMPWEVDGRRWHTIERVSRTGKPCRWEGAALDWVVERVHELGAFSETDWNHRTQVEIAATVKSQGWFLHASTGEEWLLWLTFRVARNAFKEESLRRQLGIRPLDQTEGLQAYGNYERVRVKNQRGPWQSIEIGIHWLREIDTLAFRDFLKKAVASFQDNIRRMQTKPEDLMPWKINGQRWHLGDKGFPPGRRVEWDRGILPKMLDLIQEAIPDLEIRWDSRHAISFRPAGARTAWCYWKTKVGYGLDCIFKGRKGWFNLAQVESLGWQREVITDRPKADFVRLVFRSEEQIKPAVLKEFLRKHVEGFLAAKG